MQEINEHYHCEERGCKVKIKKQTYRPRHHRGDRRLPSMQGIYCETHKVECSKTGWEWGWYGGTNSMEININSRIPKINLLWLK